jgi:hypothetical protein
MKKIDVILGLFLVFANISCDKENQGIAFKLKNGSYMGSLKYDNNQLWESFLIRKDSFVELASGGVMFQKFPKYCLTEGTYEIIDDSIYFRNIQAAQPPNGNIHDYQKEYLLMGSFYIEECSDSSIVFSRIVKNGSQKYDLRLYYETK